MFAYEGGLADRVKAKLEQLGRPAATISDTVNIDWRRIETGLHTIEVAEIPIGRLDATGTGGAIAALGDQLVFVTPTGRIGLVNPDGGSLQYIEMRVPMGLDELYTSTAWNSTKFSRDWVRVADILFAANESGDHWLYVNHHAYADGKVCTRVSRIGISLAGATLVTQQNWETFYTVSPCVDLAERDYEFAGHMTGGRMTLDAAGKILMTVGDHGHGYWEPQSFENGRLQDWSSLLRLDPQTGKSEVFATGFRSPQGLGIDNQGAFWVTDHGPQGGDELNRVLPGAHHGWPDVVLGTEYAKTGEPRMPLASGAPLGRHDGFRQPVLAFIPSVGINQVLAVPAGTAAFPAWAGDLLVATLREQTLYRVRTDGDRAVYAEPIPLGKRLRDLIPLPDGRFALLTDDAHILLIRDPDVHTSPDNSQPVISGYGAIAAAQAAAISSVGLEWGRDTFRHHCGSCHVLDGTDAPAPPLHGLLGRRIASVEGYPYSPALSQAKGRWTKQNLRAFIADPAAAGYPGAAMLGVNLTDAEFKALTDFLDQQSAPQKPDSK